MSLLSSSRSLRGNRLVLAGALVAGLAGGIFTSSPSSSHEAPSKVGPVPHSEIASAPTISTPTLTPTPTPTPVPPDWAPVLTPDEALTDVARDALQQDARAYARSATASQRKALLVGLSQPGVACGRAHAAVLAGALSVGIEPETVTEVLETMSTECNAVIVESVGFVPNAHPSIARSLETLTKTSFKSDEGHGHQQDREAVRQAAWLSYGSLAETARRKGDLPLAVSIDATLAATLKKAPTRGSEHLLLVRAAGNAGCEACAATLAIDARSNDPELRRAAVASHRFLPSTGSVELMCHALETDSESSTRDLAAWALEWRTSAPAVRTRCLETAAVKDRSKGVRLQATRALGALSDDRPEAREALVRLSVREGDVGLLAYQTLIVSGMHPDEDLAQLTQE